MTKMICGSGTKRICDLPTKVVGEEIFARIPRTSLREVRSTCKLWDSLSREWVLGKAAATRQFVGFMTKDSKVCSMQFHVRKEEEDFADVSIKQVDLLSHLEISQVFHCEGLLLCVAEDKSRLLLWNPYLGQTRSIGPRSSFHRLARYALGYDKKNRTHKILRFVDNYTFVKNNDKFGHVFGFEIYDLSSDSWRVLDVNPDWEVEFDQRGASLKGDAYFFAREKIVCPPGRTLWTEEIDDFLLCFDFTRERFGPRLPLPFHSSVEEVVALSCVGEKQLAVLYQKDDNPSDPLGIWVTTMIEPEAVSWIKFLKLDKRPVTCVDHVQLRMGAGSFFIDEEEKAAVIFDVDGYEPTETGNPHHTAFIIGDDGYFKCVSLGEAPIVGVKPDHAGYEDKAKMIQTLLFVSGLNTFLQSFFGTHLPAVIGASYSYVPTTVSIVLASRYSDILDPQEKFEKIMCGIQGALIFASFLQILVGFSGLWRIVVRCLSPLSVVPLVALAGFGLYEQGFPMLAKCIEIGLPEIILLVTFTQYIPHLMQAERYTIFFHRFAVIFSVVIVWFIAHILMITYVLTLSNYCNCTTTK